MERIKLQIPADFILQHARVSWRELQYGLLKHLIDAHAIIAHWKRYVDAAEERYAGARYDD